MSHLSRAGALLASARSRGRSRHAYPWAAALTLVVATAVSGCTPATAVKARSDQADASASRSAGPASATGAQVRRAGPGRRGRHHQSRTHRRATRLPVVRAPGVPASAMPNPSLTPGKAVTASRAAVCVPGYSSRVRNVPASEAEAVYARYGVAHVPYAHEVDHLVSLELGGSNEITNLWPEPYAGRWGARTKDVLENRLHDLVCSGALSLRHAQRIEAANWVAAYRRYVGSPPSRAHNPSGHRRTRATAVRPSSGGSCEPGYSPCLPRVADLDCADIPASERPVRVTGSDPYGLDADGNGYGCTS